MLVFLSAGGLRVPDPPGSRIGSLCTIRRSRLYRFAAKLTRVIPNAVRDPVVSSSGQGSQPPQKAGAQRLPLAEPFPRATVRNCAPVRKRHSTIRGETCVTGRGLWVVAFSHDKKLARSAFLSRSLCREPQFATVRRFENDTALHGESYVAGHGLWVVASSQDKKPACSSFLSRSLSRELRFDYFCAEGDRHAKGRLRNPPFPDRMATHVKNNGRQDGNRSRSMEQMEHRLRNRAGFCPRGRETHPHLSK